MKDKIEVNKKRLTGNLTIGELKQQIKELVLDDLIHQITDLENTIKYQKFEIETLKFENKTLQENLK